MPRQKTEVICILADALPSFPQGIQGYVNRYFEKTSFLNHDYFSRWFEPPGLYLAAPVPILVGVTAILFARALKQRAETRAHSMVLRSKQRETTNEIELVAQED